MHVAALWRYPVKSLAGEQLHQAVVTTDGLQGDRLVHVRGPRGPLTGRTRPGLLTLPVNTVDAATLIRQRAGDTAQLRAYAGPERFDIGNLLVATDGAVARFGHDVRRLRPNLLLGGVPADVEATWPGHALTIGDAVIGLHSMRMRCNVTTIDPDTGHQNLDVFRRLRNEFGGELALNAWVIRPGTIHVGDTARLTDTNATPHHLGGWIVGAPYPGPSTRPRQQPDATPPGSC